MSIDTYSDLIDRILVNAGDSRAGNADERTEILEDLRDFLETELPESIGGPILESSFARTLGGPAAHNDANGVVPWPARVRAITGPIRIDTTDRPLPATRIFRNPERFYRRWSGTITNGKPTHVLIYGMDLIVRPVPPLGGGDPVYSATVWAQMFPSITLVEDTAIHRNEDLPLLIAFGSALQAVRSGNKDAQDRFGQLLEARMSDRRMGRAAHARSAVGYGAYL